jgi:luciferase family oxidoreductase group 1
MKSLPLSILDLAIIGSGSTASKALQDSVALAKRGEELGYVRHWFAEHHGMPSVASSSPELLIGHVAQATKRIRVGSGGIMLPNHVPLKVAENFHTLEALHPGRIDLGIGRAPGTDQATVRALRPFDASKFASLLQELMSLSRGDFADDHPFANVRVMPDDVALPPIWMLGSSGASAKVAGQLGLGYGFASHFSPAPAEPALRSYRDNFEPSEQFPEPHVILAVSVVCAETDDQADYLAKSLDLSRVRLQRGEFSSFPTPEEASAYSYTPFEQAIVDKNRRQQFIGSPETVHAELSAFADRTGADELMVTSFMHSPQDRLRSYELLAESFGM